MSKPIEPKATSHRPKRIHLPWLIVCLIIVIGIISFIYADGLTMLYRTWYNFTSSGIQLEVKPQTTIISANSSSPIYIDLQLRNKQKQILDGSNIVVSVLSGQADITKADPPPTDVSKRLWLRAPAQPQLVNLAFTYKHLRKTLAIEIYDPAPPAAPIIKAPVTGTNFTTATPIIAGEAADNNSVEIYADGVLNSTFKTDDNKFSGPLQIALKRGKHKIAATAINKYGVRSIFTTAIAVEIQTPDPEIDLANLLIKPNPAKAGSTFQIFVPISSNIRVVQLMLDGATYPLQDTNNSSIFSGVIPTPRNIGLYRLSLMITTLSGETILAEKVASIQVN